MGIGDQLHAPTALTTVQEAVYTLERLCEAVEYLAPPSRFDPRHRLARSEPLYRLSYPDPP